MTSFGYLPLLRYQWPIASCLLKLFTRNRGRRRFWRCVHDNIRVRKVLACGIQLALTHEMPQESADENGQCQYYKGAGFCAGQIYGGI
jgi:hypothetical protein